MEFLRHIDSDDVYHDGPTPGGRIYVIPGMWTSMPEDLMAALRARRRAAVTGQCLECGTAMDSLKDEVGTMQHESDCMVTDGAVQPLVMTWVKRVGRYARGRRIVEDPT